MTGYPTIISFYGGSEYYYEAAKVLQADCDRLSLQHDIRELPRSEKLDWISICKAKIAFYHEQLQKLNRPVLWVDVDTRLLGKPEMLRDCRFDIAGLIRKWRHLRDYDPLNVSRFWIPGLLYLGNTRDCLAFVEHMQSVLEGSPENVTDDYVLHE